MKHITTNIRSVSLRLECKF